MGAWQTETIYQNFVQKIIADLYQNKEDHKENKKNASNIDSAVGAQIPNTLYYYVCSQSLFQYFKRHFIINIRRETAGGKKPYPVVLPASAKNFDGSWCVPLRFHVKKLSAA